MRTQLETTFAEVISVDNLLQAWCEFVRGKRGKPDVQAWGRELMDNLLTLHAELARNQYQHSGYYHFAIADPKPRDIHKASVRDRVLNHALYRQLYPFFDRTFIADSFSCRRGKGTHAAMDRFDTLARRVSRNHTRTCWVLKCDIRKFFASIDQPTLLAILDQSIADTGVMALITQTVRSFQLEPGKGLPLGNLTSQLLVNVYMNEFDQFVKHRLKVRNYVRYADDFVLLAADRDWLLAQVPPMQDFLKARLGLELHPTKISLETYASGVDFLGWVHFADHRVLRSVTGRRLRRNLASEASLQSYLGMLSHGNAYGLRQTLVNDVWLWQ